MLCYRAARGQRIPQVPYRQWYLNGQFKSLGVVRASCHALVGAGGTRSPPYGRAVAQACCRPYSQGLFDDYSLHHTTIICAGTNPCVAEYHAGMVRTTHGGTGRRHRFAMGVNVHRPVCSVFQHHPPATLGTLASAVASKVCTAPKSAESYLPQSSLSARRRRVGCAMGCSSRRPCRQPSRRSPRAGGVGTGPAKRRTASSLARERTCTWRVTTRRGRRSSTWTLSPPCTTRRAQHRG